MKVKTRLTFVCLKQLGELTDIVTLLAIVGDLFIVCFEESLTMHIIGTILLVIAFILASYIYKQYHKQRVSTQRKKMIQHKKRLIKHVNKRSKQNDHSKA